MFRQGGACFGAKVFGEPEGFTSVHDLMDTFLLTAVIIIFYQI